MKTALTEILEIEYPIIQGGMAWVAEANLAAAVSNAGGLGIIGAGGADAKWVEDQIIKAKTLTDKPFGVNIMLMNPQADEIAKVVAKHNVKVVTTGAGNPGKYMEMWKNAGIKVMPVVASVASSPFNFVISPFNAVFLPERFFFAFSIPENASDICFFDFATLLENTISKSF